MGFKGTRGEWYKMEARRMGVPFIIASGNETIFQAYGEYAEANVKLVLCATEMLEMLTLIRDKYLTAHAPESVFDELESLIKKSTE